MSSAAQAMLPPVMTFFATLALLAYLMRSKVARAVLDHPNQRSLHATPVPRIGGVAMAAGVAIGWMLGSMPIALTIAIGACALLALSLLDDVLDLPVMARLGGHLLVAAWVTHLLVPTGSALWLVAGLTLAIAWMTNLYNFMDGSDGLAGGMALFGFGFYALAAWVAGSPDFAVASGVIAAAAMAFLIYNFHPARIFMGDAGSVPLGFLSGALGLAGWSGGLWPAWFPVLVFSPFVVDATATLVRRAMKKEKVWRAHREHYYQRLIQLGWGHRRTALAEYGLMIAAGASGLWAQSWDTTGQALFCFAWACVYIVLMWSTDRAWRRYSGAGSS